MSAFSGGPVTWIVATPVVSGVAQCNLAEEPERSVRIHAGDGYDAFWLVEHSDLHRTPGAKPSKKVLFFGYADTVTECELLATNVTEPDLGKEAFCEKVAQ